MAIADAVKPVQEVSVTELSAAFLAGMKNAHWGTASVEADDKINVTLTLKDPLGTALVAVERLRLTCSAGTMALLAAGNGVVLSGSGTNDMIIETDVATGTFDLEVTDVAAETVTVIAGVTQGSGICDCSRSKDLVFA